MQILLIFLCTISSTVQTVLKKQYSLRCKDGDYFFSALVSLFALFFFLFTSEKVSIEARILPYSFAFSITYALATVYALMALKIGSLAITSLIMSYSLIIPTIYGFLFLGESIKVSKIVGILILMISLFLVRNKSIEVESKVKLNAKWIVYIAIAFISNGMCSVIQNAQQRKFNGAENRIFMIVALAISTLILLIISLVFERDKMVNTFKKGMVWAASCGICNGTTNLLVMLIIATVASSVFFPVLSASQLVLIFVISVFIYKERFIARQIVGIICGLVSIVLLNI